MHAEYLGKTLEERALLAEANIYAMIKEILNVSGLSHECSAVSFVFSDSLDGSKDTYTRNGLSMFSGGFTKVKDVNHLNELLKGVDASSLLGMNEGTKIIQDILNICVKTKLVDGVPEELKPLFMAMLNKKKEEDKGPDDFLGELKKFM